MYLAYNHYATMMQRFILNFILKLLIIHIIFQF